MPIIIDGWNFIRDKSSALPDEDGDSLASAESLIRYLKDFQLTHSDPIILVFDSRHEFLDINYKSSSRLTVVPVTDADDYIKRYIDKVPERQRRSLRVISSDNSVYYYAKSSYATAIKSKEFWDKLCKA